VNGEGQTLAIIPGPAEFSMGSPPSEPERLVNENMHRVRIPHSFAIATTEVTTEQFKRFLNANPSIKNEYPVTLGGEQQPIAYITWAEAAQYCRWLSEQENIREDQMCYPPLAEIKPGMELPSSCLARTGYRLPTEQEWEYACRAGTVTSRYFGGASELLDSYGWHSRNSDLHPWPVGQLKPNDFGLFDMLGNVGEWCHDRRSDSEQQLSRTFAGSGKKASSRALENPLCAWRGGGFMSLPSRLRSAAVADNLWATRGPPIGFRIARTHR
jgi:formylglycine-generating enzyme required for sulfatase activity